MYIKHFFALIRRCHLVVLLHYLLNVHSLQNATYEYPGYDTELNLHVRFNLWKALAFGVSLH